jgi:hypothetical protein
MAYNRCLGSPGCLTLKRPSGIFRVIAVNVPQ